MVKKVKKLKDKNDTGKLRYDLIPPEVTEELVKVMMSGNMKYPVDSWKSVVNENPLRYYSAAMRHLEAWRKGEMLDKDDGLPHLSHAYCCLAFLVWNNINNENKGG